MTHDLRMPTGGTLASLAAAAGLLVGLRTIASYELPRPVSLLGIEPMAREGLGVLWSQRASWPAEFQAVALERLVGLLAALVLAAIAVATLNACVAMWGRGKGAEQLVRLMTEMDRTPSAVFDPYLDVNPAERQVSGDWYGLEVLPGSAIVSNAPGVLVIGSLSPGACRDLAVQARRAAPNAHVVEPVPWRRTDEIDVSAAPALVGSPA